MFHHTCCLSNAFLTKGLEPQRSTTQAIQGLTAHSHGARRTANRRGENRLTVMAGIMPRQTEALPASRKGARPDDRAPAWLVALACKEGLSLPAPAPAPNSPRIRKPARRPASRNDCRFPLMRRTRCRCRWERASSRAPQQLPRRRSRCGEPPWPG